MRTSSRPPLEAVGIQRITPAKPKGIGSGTSQRVWLMRMAKLLSLIRIPWSNEPSVSRGPPGSMLTLVFDWSRLLQPQYSPATSLMPSKPVNHHRKTSPVRQPDNCNIFVRDESELRAAKPTRSSMDLLTISGECRAGDVTGSLPEFSLRSNLTRLCYRYSVANLSAS